MMPTQVYAPRNFKVEVRKIRDACKQIYANGSWHWFVDSEGNRFFVDYETQEIFVN
jgi:hypothetical protein